MCVWGGGGGGGGGGTFCMKPCNFHSKRAQNHSDVMIATIIKTIHDCNTPHNKRYKITESYLLAVLYLQLLTVCLLNECPSF